MHSWYRLVPVTDDPGCHRMLTERRGRKGMHGPFLADTCQTGRFLVCKV